jgi:hypothetical protein
MKELQELQELQNWDRLVWWRKAHRWLDFDQRRQGSDPELLNS